MKGPLFLVTHQYKRSSLNKLDEKELRESLYLPSTLRFLVTLQWKRSTLNSLDKKGCMGVSILPQSNICTWTFQ